MLYFVGFNIMTMAEAWLYVVGGVLIVTLSAFFCFMLQRQLRRVTSSSEASSITLPMARTVADLLDATDDEKQRFKTIATLENTRFRTLTITLYSGDGEVYMDTAIPTDGRLPVPPTQRQAVVFELLKANKIDESSNGVRVTTFRTCSPKGGERSLTSIGAYVSKCGIVVAVQACGADV